MPSADQMFTTIEAYDAMTITQLQVSFFFVRRVSFSTARRDSTTNELTLVSLPFSSLVLGLQNRKGHEEDCCSPYDS